MDVPEEAPLPDIDEIKADAERARAEGFRMRVFSEMFLYPRVGKDDARFILGVADEYEHVINALGPEAVVAILDVKPQLVQRLGVGQLVTESLADARSDESLRRVEQFPPQVVLDTRAAEALWKGAHDLYKRTFNPEQDIDRDTLRAYHLLTDGLGPWYKEQRQKEQDRLPEKLERQKERRARLPKRQEARERIRTALADDEAALQAFNEVFVR